MRPPWYQQGADAELEALQTDVMRFIAILGLCLAAIFSLVHSAAREENDQSTVTASTASTPGKQLKPEPVPVPELPPERAIVQAPVARKAEPASVPAARTTVTPVEEAGFSLEFASDEAFRRMLAAGRVRLYARVDGQFWLSQANGSGFTVTAAPDSYYGMLAATVPLSLRRALAGAASASPAEWGVQLEPELVLQLQGIMRERSAGILLIQADGELAIEAP
jgi:hypothetical protein